MILSKDGKILLRFFNSDINPNGSFDIPNNVDTVGDGMYNGCTRIQTLILPNNVTKIGLWGFSGCRNLRALTLPASIVSISDNAFINCPSLEVIMIDSRAQYEIGRVTNLVPKYLQSKALGIELAQEVFRLRKTQLDENIKITSRNPLFRFFNCNLSQIAKVKVEKDANPSLESNDIGLQGKVLEHMNRFLLNKNHNYQKAKNSILHEPLPHNDSELATYEINLKKIVPTGSKQARSRAKPIADLKEEESNHHTLR